VALNGSNLRIGILAGRGALPYIAARSAIQAGVDVRIFPYTDEPPPADLEGICERVILTKMYSSVIRRFEKSSRNALLLLGKADRKILYSNPSFDLKTVYALTKMRSQSDTDIFEYFAKEFEKRGIRILLQNEYLHQLILKPGRYGKKLKEGEIQEILFGFRYAREMTRLDIGQTVVVGGRAVLAVEAAEGTDRCIRRGGELFNGKGAIVCKLPKENHDLRFDIPAVGVETIESMHGSGCRVLAFESARTLVVDPHDFLERARKWDITVLSVDPGRINEKDLSNLNRRESKAEFR
jgi:hypothetical protein